MAVIKSYTDIKQSRKLAEILPLESADMYYNLGESNIPNYIYGSHSDFRCYTMCWSLAALLNILPMITKDEDTANPFIAKTSDNEYYVVYATLTEEVDSSTIYNNPVDACVAMIEYLYRLKIL